MKHAKLLAMFLIGVIVGAFLSGPVGAQANTRLYGTLSGNPIALVSSAAGELYIKVN